MDPKTPELERSTIKARRLTPEDAESYCALRREMIVESPWAYFGAPGDDDASDAREIASLLADEAEHGIVAVVDGFDPRRLVAVAGVRRVARLKARHRAVIWGVYCAPQARGRGCGRAVVWGAIEVARAWPGIERVALSVSSRGVEAVSLYRSMGFVHWGTDADFLRVDGRSYDEVHMVLEL